MLTQDPEYSIMFPKESVNFLCKITAPSEWKYLWYKDDTLLIESTNIYTISSVTISQEGSYTCKAKRGSDEAFLTDSSEVKVLEVEGKFVFAFLKYLFVE